MRLESPVTTRTRQTHPRPILTPSSVVIVGVNNNDHIDFIIGSSDSMRGFSYSIGE